MNAAFRRSEAIERLESYAPVIAEHLALTSWFPDHLSCKHWQAELDAWSSAMKRYNKSKMKKKGNYTKEIMLDALEATIDCDDKKDFLVIQVESHGLTVSENPNWEVIKKAFVVFAHTILDGYTDG